MQLLRGAEEACWAHNPKVLGSKPSGATSFFASLMQARELLSVPIDSALKIENRSSDHIMASLYCYLLPLWLCRDIASSCALWGHMVFGFRGEDFAVVRFLSNE